MQNQKQYFKLTLGLGLGIWPNNKLYLPMI